MADEQSTTRKGREGARWINEKPTPEEFGAWFRENVKLHQGMDPEKYIGGVVLIPVVDERAKTVTGFNNVGAPIIETRPELSYVPYAKVETRVTYFWDLIELKAGEWVGVLEPIHTQRPSVEPVPSQERVLDGDRIIERDTSRVPATSQLVEQLPPGFFLLPVPVGQAYTHFLCCSYRCAIYDKADLNTPMREGRGTKMVPLVLGRDRHYADQNSIMKAETGAIGRALGLAGVFTIPGSGVATAEDMIEAASAAPTAQQEAAEGGEAAPSGGAGPAAPTQPPSPRTGAEQVADEQAELIQRARALVEEANRDFPDVLAAFKEWGEQRTPPVTNLGVLKGGALRGAVRKLEKLLDDAKQAREAQETETTSPGPEGQPEEPEPERPSPTLEGDPGL